MVSPFSRELHLGFPQSPNEITFRASKRQCQPRDRNGYPSGRMFADRRRPFGHRRFSAFAAVNCEKVILFFKKDIV